MSNNNPRGVSRRTPMRGPLPQRSRAAILERLQGLTTSLMRIFITEEMRAAPSTWEGPEERRHAERMSPSWSQRSSPPSNMRLVNLLIMLLVLQLNINIPQGKSIVETLPSRVYVETLHDICPIRYFLSLEFQLNYDQFLTDTFKLMEKINTIVLQM